jgi:hypothetical protein
MKKNQIGNRKEMRKEDVSVKEIHTTINAGSFKYRINLDIKSYCLLKSCTVLKLFKLFTKNLRSYFFNNKLEKV